MAKCIGAKIRGGTTVRNFVTFVTLCATLLGFLGGCIGSESEGIGELSTLTSGDLLRAWRAGTGPIGHKSLLGQNSFAWPSAYHHRI